jgi:surface protein
VPGFILLRSFRFGIGPGCGRKRQYTEFHENAFSHSLLYSTVEAIDNDNKSNNYYKKRRLAIVMVDSVQEAYQQWLHHDEGVLFLHALSFLDIKTLLQKERVNKTWRKLCKKTMQTKCGRFETKQELKDAIDKYCQKNPTLMEDIACTYGYPIDSWDVSRIQDMSKLFYRRSNFNDYIGSWDVSKVTDMSYMFHGAEAFNQDFGAWNVSNVTTMSHMFHGANAFDQDIGSWDVTKVTDMGSMFYDAHVFNQDIGSWDISGVTDMWGMFCDAHVFNQDIGSWDVASVKNMCCMFEDARAFNQDIGSWDVSRVTDMCFMFKGAYAFDQDIRSWDVFRVREMSHIFCDARAFNQEIGAWPKHQVECTCVTKYVPHFSDSRYIPRSNILVECIRP